MGGPGDRLDVAVDVAVEDEPRIGREGALVVVARERALLHVTLVHLLVGLVLDVRAGHLVEGDGIVLDHEPGLVYAVLPAEEVGDRALAAREEDDVR